MEFQTDKSFFSGRLKSMVFALKGAFKLVTTEHSVIVQTTIAFLLIIANLIFYYCPPPVLKVPIVLATAVPIPVPVGVWIALSYLTDIVIVAGSEVLYANVL